MNNSFVSVKEILACAVLFLIAGIIIPLLFYPVSTWLDYFTRETPLIFLQKNTGYFIICEFWGFAFYLGIKAVTK